MLCYAMLCEAKVIIWSTKDGGRLLELRHDGAVVYAIAFSPNGRTIASGGDDEKVTLRWCTDENKGKVREVVVHSHAVRSIAFAPKDGFPDERLASGSADGTVVITRLGKCGDERRTLLKNKGRAVAWSAAAPVNAGDLASVGVNKRLTILDTSEDVSHSDVDGPSSIA